MWLPDCNELICGLMLVGLVAEWLPDCNELKCGLMFVG